MKQAQPISSKQTSHSFLLSGFILGVSLITVKIIGAFFKIPLMNLLSETGMAYFTGAYTVFTAIYALTVSGLTGASAKLTASYRALGEGDALHSLKKLSLYLYGGIGMCGTLLMLLGANYFAKRIGCVLSAPAIMTAAAAVFFCCLMAVYRGYFEGLSNMTPTAVSQVVEAVGKLLFGLFGVYVVLRHAKECFANGEKVFGQTAASLSDAINIALPYAAAAAMLGITVSTLCGLISLLLFDRFQKPHLPLPGKAVVFKRSLLKQLIKAALPITVSTAMLQLIPLIDTMTVINRLTVYLQKNGCVLADIPDTNESAVFCFGIFSACTTLFNLIPTLASLIAKIALPTASGFDAIGESRRKKQYMNSILALNFYLTAPAAAGMYALAKPILQVLYARQPTTAVMGESVLQILSVAAVFSSMLFPLTAFLQAGKYFWSPVCCQLFGAVMK